MPTVVAVIIKPFEVFDNFKDLLTINPVDIKLIFELLFVLYNPYTSSIMSSSITSISSPTKSTAKALIDIILEIDNKTKHIDIIFFKTNTPYLIVFANSIASSTEWLSHIDFLLNKFDENQWSHTYWSYYKEIFESPIINCLVRPFPVAVCGNIKQYSYDKTKGIFTLEFEQDKEYEVPTEIFINKQINNIEITSNHKIEIEKNFVRIYTDVGSHKIKITFAQ